MAQRRVTRRPPADDEAADEREPSGQDEQEFLDEDELEADDDREILDEDEPEADDDREILDEDEPETDDDREILDEDEPEAEADGRRPRRRRPGRRDPGRARRDPGPARRDPGRARRSSRPGGGTEDGTSALTVREAARAALREIAELTAKQVEGITGAERTEDGWMIDIEVVEDRRIPSSTDLLATYETTLNSDGELVSYRRVRRYTRGRGEDGEESR